MKSPSRGLVVGVVILCAAALASAALARGGGGGRGGGRGGSTSGNLCLSGSTLDRSLTTLDLLIKASGSQKAALDELRKGAKDYAETMSHVCAGDSTADIPAKIAASDKRLETALAGVRKLKPAAEKFYATLTDEQKTEANLFVDWPGL